jgi:hypothetical protein
MFAASRRRPRPAGHGRPGQGSTGPFPRPGAIWRTAHTGGVETPVPTAPPWLDELRLEPGPPWLSMGIRTLDLDGWLVIDERFDAELAFKRQLLHERPDEVFAATPAALDPSAEVLELVIAWLAAHPPVPVATSAPSPEPVATRRPEDHPTATSSEGGAGGWHPLDAAGRLVQEDLCVMVRGEDGYRLEAASLCFPSHWRLHDKLGRNLAAIHAPVPHYAEELEAKVDTFFDRLRVDRPVVRRNWSIHSHDDLYRPEPHESPDSFAPDDSGIDQVWLRSERQTLVRLPRTGAVLFTIKTQQCPVTALRQRPDLAVALAARLAAEQADLASRGHTIPFPPWLILWLEQTQDP